MKIIIVMTIGLLLASIFGFLFAGLYGAMVFGGILTVSLYLARKRRSSFAFYFIFFIILSMVGYGSMSFGGLLGADPRVLYKIDLIEKDLINKKYNPTWVIISQKRSRILNSILSNSVDGSHHLKGLAVDIYVFDINGDGTFDKADIAILQKSNSVIEGKYPELAGSFGDYFLKSNGYLTRHMIHLDIGGKKVRFHK